MIGAATGICALVISAVSMLISYLTLKRDKADVRIKVTHGVASLPSGISDVKLMLDIVNVGRRPITITSFGFKTKDNQNIIVLNPEYINPLLPAELKEGEVIKIMTDKKRFIEDIKEKNMKIKYAYASAATGKTYTGKNRVIFRDLNKYKVFSNEK